MEEDKKFNMIDEYYKEKTKLDMVSEIKDLFEKCYSKHLKEKKNG